MMTLITYYSAINSDSQRLSEWSGYSKTQHKLGEDYQLDPASLTFGYILGGF